MQTEQFLWSSQSDWNSTAPPGALGGAAQLVLFFGGAQLENVGRCFDSVRAAYPNAHLFGCSTAGEIQGARVSDDTVAVTAVAFEHTRVAFARTRIESPAESFAAGGKLAAQFDPAGLRHLFVLSEGLLVNGSDLVNGIKTTLPQGVTASGGFAGDGNRLQTTHVWSAAGPEQSTAIALGFYGERLRLGISASGGWRPFGPMRLISKARKNVLFEFDGNPALPLYKRYLGKHAANLPASALLFPLELRVGSEDQGVLRAILAVDEEAQSMTFAGNMPGGHYARFMMGQLNDLVVGAQDAAKATVARLTPAQAELSILVSCNGRRAVFKQRIEEEIEAVRQVLGEKTTMTGFYSYGEISPAEGEFEPQLHNETMTITSLSET